MTDDIVKDILGLIAPVIELQPELVLTVFLFREPLQQHKAADPLSLPVHRGGGEIEVGISQLDEAGGLLPTVGLGKLPGEVPAYKGQGLADGVLPAQAQHGLRHGVKGEDPPVPVHAQNAGLQRAHEDVQIGLRLQIGAPEGGKALAGVGQ